MRLKGAVLSLRDADMKLGCIVPTTEQQVLEDEGLREARPLGEKAPPYCLSGPGGAHAVPGRGGGSLRKTQCDAA